LKKQTRPRLFATKKMLRNYRLRTRLRYIKRNNLIFSPNSGTFDIQCRFNRKISTANVRRRLLIWETEKKRQDFLKTKTQNTINITLEDGTVKQGIAGVTTPLECAKSEFDIMFIFFYPI
jgi:hypothetical protein